MNLTVIGGSECRNEWLKPSDIKGMVLAEWEVAHSCRLEEEKYKDTSNKRRAQRDQVAAMRVTSFKDSAVGKLLLSRTITARGDAAPNRLSDCMGALDAMRADDFLLYEINSSSLDQCTADAT